MTIASVLQHKGGTILTIECQSPYMISDCHQLRMLHAVLCCKGQALLNRDTGRNLRKPASLLPLEK